MPSIPRNRGRRPACVLAAAVAIAGTAAAQHFDELTGAGLPREFDRAKVLVLEDVDGDAHPDLVVGEGTLFPGAALRLDLGGPDGVFAVAPAGAMPARRCVPTEIACADFDADGDPDLFVANRDLLQNAFYVNDGAGRFTDETSTRLPTSADDSRAVAAADVDGDGDLDLIVANVLGPDVLLLNDGTGRFRAGAALPDLPTDDPTSVAFLDADGDGDPDVVLGNGRGQNRLWRNSGGGVFVDATASTLPVDQDVTTAVAVADVDGDGAPDLLIGNHETPDRAYRNDGTGRFTDRPAWMPASFGPTVAMRAFDADQDGDPDVFVARYGGVDMLLLNDGTGALRGAPAPWPAIEDHTVSVAVADVDGDGDTDVVTGGGRSILSPGRKQLLLNEGNGTFRSATAVAWPNVSADTFAVAANGDLDGDGHLDVVVSAGSDVETWRGDGLGGLSTRTVVMTGIRPDVVQALVVGDVDSDGDPDVVVGSTSANVLLRNDGTGVLTADPAAMSPGGRDTRAFVLVDVDSDGDPDLVEGNAGSSPSFAQQNRLLLNDGTGQFTDGTARLPARADFTYGVAAADVDRDGDADLVFGNWSVPGSTTPRQPNRLLLNDGTGRFADAPAGTLPLDDDPTVAVVLGDVDGDGDADLVTGNVRRQNRLYRNDGTGRFVEDPAALPVRNDPTFAIALVDFDDDGDVDVLCGNDDADNTVLRNDGPGGFVDLGPAATAVFPGATTALAVADLDHDGDVELLVANRSGQRDLLLLGLARQVDLPVPLRAGRGFTVDVYSRPAVPGTRAHLWVAPQRAPPLSIPPFGELLLDPNRLWSLGEVGIPASEGRGTFALAIPPTAAFVGVELFFQSLVYAPSNPAGARLTNASRRVVGS